MSDKSRLSDVPSKMIREAISDLSEVEENPAYTVDMFAWHQPYDNGCHVCLAGAVMATRPSAYGPVKVNEYFDPASVDEKTLFWQPFKRKELDRLRWKLVALNSFRKGDVAHGLKLMGVEPPPGLAGYHRVTYYHVDAEAFKRDVLAIATALEGFGL